MILPKLNKNPFLFLTLLFVFLSVVSIAQENEEDMREKAEALFEEEKYNDAFTLYSQLLSLNLQSPEYNYRFGACHIYTDREKEQALKYLSFAVTADNPPALAHFYYGLGLHLNYRFEKAIKQYNKYKESAGKKDREAKIVDHYIDQCEDGKTLVSSFTDISVLQKSVLPRTEFYRNYDLSEFGGKIIVKPEDFMSEEDKKRDAKFLMYFQESAELIYYGSYSEKNETGKDLYFIQKLPTGGWSQAKKLPESINTEYDEDYPFIHPDGNVMYFASKGHNSMGGYDIFKSTRRGDGSWTTPENMEFAINTPWDDFMFISDLDETFAWFASNRETSYDQVSVYRIGIQRIPLDLTLIKGSFIAEGSRKAKITVEDMVQNKVVGTFSSERQFGEYILDLRGSGQYKFIVEAEESNSIHTGVVEVPRGEGLKQFRQEMNLVVVDGKEQLQIINHFDEPLEESILTADILKRQASLNVNSDENSVRSMHIIDDGSTPTASEDDVSTDEKLELANSAVETLRSDAEMLDKKSAALYEVVQANINEEDPEKIAEAAIAAELAGLYKTEADKRASSADKLTQELEALNSGTLDNTAFNAKYNQLTATTDNFKPVDQFESKVEKEMQSRSNVPIQQYEDKKNEISSMQEDIEAIDEEIAYYESEKENTKDEALKAELDIQIAEAKEAIPVRQAALTEAQVELDVLEAIATNAKNYAQLSGEIVAAATTSAASITNTVSAQAINDVTVAIEPKAQSNSALAAMINPEMAAELAENEVNEASESTEGETESSETASTTDTNSDTSAGDQAADEGQSPSTVDATEDETQPESMEGDMATADEPLESTSDDPATADDTSSPDGTSTLDQLPEQVASNDDINSSLAAIEAGSDEVEIVNGDYNTHFETQINSVEPSEDPLIEESQKAEIYDQWSANIQMRIDSLNDARSEELTDGESEAIDTQIADLTAQKQEKDDLASESYMRIADLSDAEAEAALTFPDPDAESTTESSTSEISETADATETASDAESDDGLPTADEINAMLAGETADSGFEPGSEENASENTSDAVEAGTNETETVESDSAEGEDTLTIPPVTPELLAAEGLPIQVIQMNSSFEAREAEFNDTAGAVMDYESQIALQEEWAKALEKEVAILTGQMEQTSAVEDQNNLEQKRALVAELRLDKIARATELKQELEQKESSASVATAQGNLQQQLYPYVENYSADAFQQIETQIEETRNPELKEAQQKTLYRNWLVGIQNEKVKTEARLANTTSSAQVDELNDQLATLNGEKTRIQSRLESLDASEGIASPSAPKTTIVEGSERFEGYTPTEVEQLGVIARDDSATSSTLEDVTDEIAAFETELEATKKKKDRAALQAQIIDKQREQRSLEMKSAYYADAASKLESAESQLLLMEEGDKMPSELQAEEAATLKAAAEKATVEAQVQYEEAEKIKKKKLRIPAIQEAEMAQHEATVQRQRADLAEALVTDLRKIEQKAIVTNHIILPGEEAVLPVVTRSLNPNEMADIAETPEFKAYTSDKRESDSIRAEIAKLDVLEQQYQQRGQTLMAQSALAPISNPTGASKMELSDLAYEDFDKADSISSVTARLTREAAFKENESNKKLLAQPEEAYMNILAYYNLDTMDIVFGSDSTEAPQLAGLDTASLGSTDAGLANIEQESTADTATDAEPFDLTLPSSTEGLNTNVETDAFANTIFEIEDVPTSSVYSESNPIPVNPPLPSGVIYKVQVGAFRNPIEQDAFKGIKPLIGETTASGLTRYSAGEFVQFGQADQAKDQIRGIGYSDAFVVAYLNGERISVAEARNVASSGGGRPATATQGGSPVASTTNSSTGFSSTPASTPTYNGPDIVQTGTMQVKAVENIGGVFLTVQIGVFSRPVTSAEIYNITPVNQENLPNGTYRYSSGTYSDEGTATQARDQIRSMGILDAFVTAYKDGQRITMDQARNELGTAPITETPVVDGPTATATFRINLGTFVGEVPILEAAKILELSSEGVEKVKNADGSSTYYYGGFSTEEEASQRALELNGEGLTQAQAERL